MCGMKRIKFIDLSFPTKRIKKEFLSRVSAFLDRANFILTDEVAEFENAFARFVGVRHCVGVSSGADALWLSLRALGIGSGDEVITQGNAYNAIVTAILRAGAVPRFADIDPQTLLIDPAKIELLITKRTVAILPVHLYGQVSNMDAVMRIARKHKLFVIEDSAQAHGATWRGRQAGSFGDASAWSFYPTKNLGAFGDAGAVTTRHKNIADTIKILRNLGQTSKNNHTHLGFNMRLDAIQAIALNLKLKYLPAATKKRQNAARNYDQLIKKLYLPIQPVSVHPRATHVYHLYVVQYANRDALRKALAKRGIETAVHYPVIPYRQPFYPKRLRKDRCPIAEQMARSILSLPLHEGITKKEQICVIDSLKEACISNA